MFDKFLSLVWFDHAQPQTQIRDETFSLDIDESVVENLHTKLSRNVLDKYSRNFGDEKDLYNCVILPNVEPKSKRNSFFNFTNPTYSSEFVEKLIIFQILKQLKNLEPSIDELPTIKTGDYYLFCFRLDKFLEENPSQSTILKDLKRSVERISDKFEKSFYSKKEINQILIFATIWLETENTFDNYKLSKYDIYFGDFSRIFRCLNLFYNHFKSDYDFISILGYEGEGTVFKVFLKKSKTLRAIKLKYEAEKNEESTRELIKLLKTDIEGKIKYFECDTIGGHLYSVMELGEQSLSDYITRNNEEGFYRDGFISKDKIIEIIEIFIKVLTSVSSINEHYTLHRDLDPKNIVKVQDYYKIINFNTAKAIDSYPLMAVRKVPYMPPESLVEAPRNGNNQKQINNGHLFSLGCILLKLFTNCPLQLDELFLNDSDISKYDDDYMYFTTFGKYFSSVSTTNDGELKLHYAIGKILNKTINTNFGVTDILSRCIITMIQRDTTKRLNCYLYKTILENVLQFLKGEIQDISLNNKNETIQLNNIPTLISYQSSLTKIINEKDRFIFLERGIGCGKGVVDKVMDKKLGRIVALKTYRESSIMNDLTRLMEAFKKAKEFDHPNVVRYLEYDVVYQSLDNFYFVIMELAEQNLKQYIESQRNLSLKEITMLFRDILKGCIYLHQNGIIHRDLKPQNILIYRIEDKVVPRISDHDECKIADLDLVRTTLVQGTREYAAPELFEKTRSNNNLYERVDIYSLGCIYLFMLINTDLEVEEKTFFDWMILNQEEKVHQFISKIIENLYGSIDIKLRNYITRLLCCSINKSPLRIPLKEFYTGIKYILNLMGHAEEIDELEDGISDELMEAILKKNE
ncbi:predicted protein [Naegleria gruberi]|uniref:non-specific serine/threonine protein kinase n=1 Tax=Naegleria gruberi TaxID=5762 RepID=D2VYV1_NAEGR|nr:uncharacterized protein NAEGRDRAFT_59622 [Naegleria gruberi]EFC38022.1 predicted protein [Naegleria gruberi]|eukprot:XP_002670766.1 predicted protein [Naegleria gruberi strain NEG-M]